MALIQTVTWCELLVRTARAGGQTKVVNTTKQEFQWNDLQYDRACKVYFGRSPTK